MNTLGYILRKSASSAAQWQTKHATAATILTLALKCTVQNPLHPDRANLVHPSSLQCGFGVRFFDSRRLDAFEDEGIVQLQMPKKKGSLNYYLAVHACGRSASTETTKNHKNYESYPKYGNYENYGRGLVGCEGGIARSRVYAHGV